MLDVLNLGCVVGDDLNVHDVPDEILGDALHEGAEHVVALALPFGKWVFLTHRTKVDPLLEVVHFLEVFAPTLVDDAQHDLSFDFTHDRLAEFGLALCVERGRIGHDDVVHAIRAVGVLELADGDGGRPEGGKFTHQTIEVPLIVGLGETVGLDEAVDGFGQVLHRGGAQVESLENLVAALVDDLALLVHHLVVLEDVLADFTVALFDGGLCALDGLRHHLRFDCLVVGHGPPHHPTEGTRGEESHELVVERKVEA